MATTRPPGVAANNPIAMKLRIHENTIRLRLSKPEVATLRETGLLQATLRLPGSDALTYSLESSPASVRATAQFRDGCLRVLLPDSAVTEWADSDRVSIRSEQVGDNGEALGLLIEKDFKCLTPREGEDEGELYPHPEQGSRSC